MRSRALWRKSDYKKSMPYYIDLVIPGFEKAYSKGLFKCPALSDRQSGEWFLSLVKDIEDAIGHRFLPIYRMGDGEFQLCVGYRHRYRKRGESAWQYILALLRATLGQYRRSVTRRGFLAKTAHWAISGDYYSKQELNTVRSKLRQQIRFVAEKGYLSLKFSCREDSMFSQQYIKPMLQWLKKSAVRLDDTNYIPAYFVYAMLTGPYRHGIYQGRRTLVITSYDDAKRDAIAKGLEREGVADVQFLPLSHDRSMYDTIDLSAVKRPVDLVLVGRGIGASAILCQLEPLNTAAIDAGYIIECLADPERKRQRTFCWPDEKRDGDYRPI